MRKRKIPQAIVTALVSFATAKLHVIQNAVSQSLGRANRRILLEFLILIMILSSVGIAMSRWSTTIIASHGNLRIDGVGVYDDRDCVTATSYLDWGTLEPGSAKNITIYIRNEGNHQATVFLASGNWHPVNAAGYMHLNWNYNGKTLEPMEVIKLTLTLSVSSAAENILDFSFDVTIGTNE
jgi:hypothetical protein